LIEALVLRRLFPARSYHWRRYGWIVSSQSPERIMFENYDTGTG
jgi:hypothetical protein